MCEIIGSFLCLYTDKGTLKFCVEQLEHLWKHLPKYKKLSPSGTFRNRTFGVKHSVLSNFAFFKQILKFSEKKSCSIYLYIMYIARLIKRSRD